MLKVPIVAASSWVRSSASLWKPRSQSAERLHFRYISGFIGFQGSNSPGQGNDRGTADLTESNQIHGRLPPGTVTPLPIHLGTRSRAPAASPGTALQRTWRTLLRGPEAGKDVVRVALERLAPLLHDVLAGHGDIVCAVMQGNHV